MELKLPEISLLQFAVLTRLTVSFSIFSSWVLRWTDLCLWIQLQLTVTSIRCILLKFSFADVKLRILWIFHFLQVKRMFRRLNPWCLKIACEGSECLVYHEFRIKYSYSYLYKNMVNCVAPSINRTDTFMSVFSRIFL
jgi:hypothetical protein